MQEPLDQLFSQMDDPAFKALISQGNESVRLKSGLDPDFYAMCFGTDAGRAVLADLYSRYVNVSRLIPGEPEGSGFYREGMAQVVHDIVYRISLAERGEQED